MATVAHPAAAMQFFRASLQKLVLPMRCLIGIGEYDFSADRTFRLFHKANQKDQEERKVQAVNASILSRALL